jgi:hypothetical protein
MLSHTIFAALLLVVLLFVIVTVVNRVSSSPEYTSVSDEGGLCDDQTRLRSRQYYLGFPVDPPSQDAHDVVNGVNGVIKVVQYMACRDFVGKMREYREDTTKKLRNADKMRCNDVLKMFNAQESVLVNSVRRVFPNTNIQPLVGSLRSLASTVNDKVCQNGEIDPVAMERLWKEIEMTVCSSS